MTHPERTRYKECGLITKGPTEDALPALDTGNRGLSTFAVIDIVQTPGPDLLRKWSEFSIPDEAVREFNFFTTELDNHPFLRSRIPPTTFKNNEKGRYFLQTRVETREGKSNMSDLSRPGAFDPDQIDGPETLRDLALITQQGIDLYGASLDNPETGLSPGEGTWPEFRPDGFVLGRLNGDDKDQVYFVDCNPLMPYTPQIVEKLVKRFNTALDEVSRQKFGMPAQDVLRTAGFNTLLPSLEDRSIMETAAERPNQIPKSSEQRARATGRVALAA